MKLLYGKGTSLTDRKAIDRRAKSKMISQCTMRALADVATEKGAKDRAKAYWNTYYCQQRIVTAESRLYTNYCKNRFCAVCCGIRKAKMINKYLPVLQTWEDPHFVTLTVRAVPAAKLKARIRAVLRAFNLIRDKYRKRNKRGTDLKLIGLKTIECCFNPEDRTYNPHLHILVPSQDIAQILKQEWLAIWTNKFTSEKAQNIRKVENPVRDLVEVIKYGTKIFTEPDGKKKKGKKGSAKIYIRALDNINAAMKGIRLLDRFGFNLPKGSNREKTELQMFKVYQDWEYDPQNRDWVSEQTESTLTAFDPPADLINMLENNIDILLE